MNAAEVRAVPVSNGYEGHFQKLDRAGWHAVCENGIPRLFDTKDQAEVAAYRAMVEYLFGRGIVRSGETASAARIAADKIFRPGKKPIEVTRPRRRQA